MPCGFLKQPERQCQVLKCVPDEEDPSLPRNGVLRSVLFRLITKALPSKLTSAQNS